MLEKKKKAVLFVPFWRTPGHVGNIRVDRFCRWLTEAGYELIIVRAGAKEAVRFDQWGQEITVVDLLGLHPDPESHGTRPPSKRKPNRFRRALVSWLFNPDPVIVWAKSAARNARVLKAIKGANFILSSSPPDSAHVGAWLLSQRLGIPHVMDMRDGWIDEPLKPLLLRSKLRRLMEERLESRIVKDAAVIQVSSVVWKELLESRYPKFVHKVHVLTNGYPVNMPEVSVTTKKPDECVLIHAGRFMSSHLKRTPELLLNALLRSLNSVETNGVVRFYGDLSEEEIKRINDNELLFNAIGWRLEVCGLLPRTEMLKVMGSADGLLLISASNAALPSKLFEYLATGLPIAYVAPTDSAVHKILQPMDCCTNLQNESLSEALKKDRFRTSLAPEEYSESQLKIKFKINCEAHFDF